MASCALLSGTLSTVGRHGFEVLIPQLIKILADINKHATDYYYYQTACPWLQVKVLKILQIFPPPEQTSPDLKRINDILGEIIVVIEKTSIPLFTKHIIYIKIPHKTSFYFVLI